MNGTLIADRISRGLGVAARRLGQPTDAYRPSGPDDPIARQNRFLRLSAAFGGLDGRFSRANVYGDALWSGVFDSAYTRHGDYLVQPNGTWFVAAQQPLLPIVCVRAERVVSLARPVAAPFVGVNSYGGIAVSSSTPLLTSWPASMLTASAGTRPNANLPADGMNATWTVLLPAVGKVGIRPADLLTDDLGRTGLVLSSELSDLGWRLIVRQAST